MRRTEDLETLEQIRSRLVGRSIAEVKAYDGIDMELVLDNGEWLTIGARRTEELCIWVIRP
jgi:hypothetical protein